MKRLGDSNYVVKNPNLVAKGTLLLSMTICAAEAHDIQPLWKSVFCFVTMVPGVWLLTTFLGIFLLAERVEDE